MTTAAEKAAIEKRIAELMAVAPTAADIRRADPARYTRLVALLTPTRTAAAARQPAA